MAMTKQTKRFLAMVGTGAIAVLCAVFAVAKHYGANRCKEDAVKAKTALVAANQEKAALRKDSILTHDSLRIARNEILMKDSVIASKDSIIGVKDSIIADRDTVIAVLTRDLQDCKDNKKPAAKKTTPVKKPVVQKPAPQKPVEQKPVQHQPTPQKPVAQTPAPQKPVAPQKPACEQKPTCEEKPAVHVDLNDDSHDNVVNINNGIVINNNYNAVVDTIKAAQKKIQYSVGKAYTGRTVRCK